MKNSVPHRKIIGISYAFSFQNKKDMIQIFSQIEIQRNREAKRFCQKRNLFSLAFMLNIDKIHMKHK